MQKLLSARKHACHCTDFYSRTALAADLPLRATGCGMQLNYP